MPQSSCDKDSSCASAPCQCRIIWGIIFPIIIIIMIVVAATNSRTPREPMPGAIATRRTTMGLGTFLTITVVGDNLENNNARLDTAFGRVAELEAILSAQDKGSALSKLNAASRIEQAPPELVRAVQLGKEWQAKTMGVFDISASPLIGLWRSCAKDGRLPTKAELAAALALMGVDKISVDAESGAIAYPFPGMRLHLGGLGKGFCADEVAALLKEQGVASALVAMSGDIRALGAKADSSHWIVGVQDPRYPADSGKLVAKVHLMNMSVSTSGNYRRFVEINGKRYSHIVDPRTGRTADAVPSVTVIGPDTVTTDILGTALSILGVKDGLKLVESLDGVDALFITLDANEKLVLTRSSGFAEYEAATD
jgi:FAD:protein FMN transferase